jgi:hypothetical protein
MALLDATSALETRGQLIATLRRRIESLEARESEARMELKLHAKKDRKVKFDGIRQHEFGAPVARVEATAVAKSNVEATAVAKSNIEATAVAKSISPTPRRLVEASRRGVTSRRGSTRRP